jgi:hypothetical protein
MVMGKGKQKKSGRPRTTLKWLLRATLLVVVLFALQVSTLAFPQPWFGHREQTDCCTVYSDVPFDAELRDVLRDVEDRLQAVELYEPGENYRIFLCGSPKRFALFARLAFVYPLVQGFNLSLLGNTFVSPTRIAELGESAAWDPPYGMREGNLAHVIAHEIVHQVTEAELGFSAYYRLPGWKSEGYAEYGSKIQVTRNDPDATLAHRIEYLESDPSWAHHPNFVRDVYRGHLMVEYLAEVRGRNFADIMKEEVTEEETYRAMIEWYQEEVVTP